MVTPQQEGTRTDHDQGTTYPSTGVNSITPADGSTQKGQSGPLETAKKIVVPADNTRVVKPIPFR